MSVGAKRVLTLDIGENGLVEEERESGSEGEGSSVGRRGDGGELEGTSNPQESGTRVDVGSIVPVSTEEGLGESGTVLVGEGAEKAASVDRSGGLRKVNRSSALAERAHSLERVLRVELDG